MNRSTEHLPKLTLAEIIEKAAGGDLAVHVRAYDGSSAGPRDAPYGLNLLTPRGTTYLATAPNDMGLARAYISGDLELTGTPPGDPYRALRAITDDLQFPKPSPLLLAQIARSVGPERMVPIAPPPQEALPRWRRIAEGLRHSRSRDAEAIHHHYDVSNRFYEMVLGPSMTYTCACYPSADVSLEAAQENKYRLVFEKLRLRAGDRLLDVGCGWGGMVRYAARRGVHVIGVTLSQQQAQWAQSAVAEEGLDGLAEVRYCDYRDVPEGDFDAISSIGLTEHIGVHNYPGYFSTLRDKLRTGGLLLNHTITRPDNKVSGKGGQFIDRYVFPDGELTGSGRVISAIQDIGGMEVRHEEDLREHYALTLTAWCRNLVENWDEAVAEVGLGTARVWGLYMAGSRLGFERNVVQLHQILAVKLDAKGGAGDLPLRPWWTA